jgi:4-hydroxy 2-oxovalerate aldolase
MPAPWITYRPELKVLDCTIRDGGLVNNHHFDDEFVRAVYETCVQAGIDYMEIGYRNSKKIFAPGKHGKWMFCEEDDIRRIIGDDQPGVKISVMIDAGKSDWRTDILPKSQSIVDMVRVAFYAHQVSEAVEMIKHAAECGYEVSANLMAVSRNTETEIDQVLELLVETPAQVLVVVDSFGAMYMEQVELLVKKYLSFARPKGKEVGIHTHNNQQLAFANTIEAIIHGASRLDASMGGLGRGAGNCPMELLIGFLRNPKFKVRPIYEFLEKYIEPLRQTWEWGPYPQYYITGQLNLHPRAAIEARSSEKKDNYVEFLDRVSAEI